MTVEDALARRIEQLVREADAAPDGAAAVRADLAALRGDLHGLSDALAAGRAETAAVARRLTELAARTDLVGGRVDEVGASLPVSTAASLDTAVTRLLEALAGRLDDAVADVRQTMTAAREDDARSSAAAGASMVEARGAIESRLAVLEDALEAVGERIESLSRDGASTTTSRLEVVGRDVAALVERVDALADVQAERTDDLLALLRDRQGGDDARPGVPVDERSSRTAVVAPAPEPTGSPPAGSRAPGVDQPPPGLARVTRRSARSLPDATATQPLGRRRGGQRVEPAVGLPPGVTPLAQPMPAADATPAVPDPHEVAGQEAPSRAARPRLRPRVPRSRRAVRGPDGELLAPFPLPRVATIAPAAAPGGAARSGDATSDRTRPAAGDRSRGTDVAGTGGPGTDVAGTGLAGTDVAGTEVPEDRPFRRRPRPST